MFKVSSWRWALLCLAVAVSGCTTYEPFFAGSPLFERGPKATTLAEVDRKVGSDKSVEFKRGFRDGCDSGHACANNPAYGFIKDESQYASQSEYRVGWHEGYDNCVVYHTAGHIYPLQFGARNQLYLWEESPTNIEIGH